MPASAPLRLKHVNHLAAAGVLIGKSTGGTAGGQRHSVAAEDACERRAVGVDSGRNRGVVDFIAGGDARDGQAPGGDVGRSGGGYIGRVVGCIGAANGNAAHAHSFGSANAFADEAGGEAIAGAFKPGPSTILIGPEGGFTPKERTAIRAAPGAKAISLGPRILRAETAALAAISAWMALGGDWR